MKYKYCPTCKKKLEVYCFNKNNSRKDGLMGQCRKCSKKHRDEVEKTKEGVLASIYRAQKASSLSRNHKKPDYTKEDFIKWCLCQKQFHDIFENWVNSNYNKWARPSVDRINDYIGYNMENIQIMTWKQNNEKSHIDRKSGRNNKMSKSVIGWSLDGKLLKEYYSLSQASRDLKISVSNICNCCKGKRNKAGGFIWTYKFCLTN